MKKTDIKMLYRNSETYENQEITVAGWIKNIRSSGAFGFIELNDGSFFKSVQVVFEAEKIDNYTQIAKLNIGSAIIVTGDFIITPEAKQPFEIKATDINIEGYSTPDYPLQKKRHSLEFLRTIAHLRPRTNLFSAILRIRSLAAFAIHDFFNQRGFVYVHTPILTGSDTEGAGEMFRVTTLDPQNPPIDENGNIDYTKDFFGIHSKLTVSGQLNAETHCMAFGKVYTFGPTFRAENSNTTRHAAEFWMIEPEIAFADLQDDMNLAEDMLKYIINYCMENAPEEFEFFNQFVDNTLIERLNGIIHNEFARITYTEAIGILSDHNDEFEYQLKWGADLQTEHERFLTEKIFKKPVFVTDYPKEIKAFYMRLNDDNKTVAAMDCLVPGVGEIIGGSQREERMDVLVSKMKELGLSEKEYWWYLDLRHYGSTKHAGFGLGFERLIMYLTGVSNIRDVQSFPRTVGNCEF